MAMIVLTPAFLRNLFSVPEERARQVLPHLRAALLCGRIPARHEGDDIWTVSDIHQVFAWR